ncbi:25982_t:CDS:2 [Gigaspora rosea]|nr:25982_t:CDS:2 [Gigaspora rosea]
MKKPKIDEKKEPKIDEKKEPKINDKASEWFFKAINKNEEICYKIELQTKYKELQQLRKLAKIYLILYVVICLLTIVIYIILRLVKGEELLELRNKIASIFSGVAGITSLIGGLSSFKSFFSKNDPNDEKVNKPSFNPSIAVNSYIWKHKELYDFEEIMNKNINIGSYNVIHNDIQKLLEPSRPQLDILLAIIKNNRTMLIASSILIILFSIAIICLTISSFINLYISTILLDIFFICNVASLFFAIIFCLKTKYFSKIRKDKFKNNHNESEYYLQKINLKKFLKRDEFMNEPINTLCICILFVISLPLGLVSFENCKKCEECKKFKKSYAHIKRIELNNEEKEAITNIINLTLNIE